MKPSKGSPCICEYDYGWHADNWEGKNYCQAGPLVPAEKDCECNTCGNVHKAPAGCQCEGFILKSLTPKIL